MNILDFTIQTGIPNHVPIVGQPNKPLTKVESGTSDLQEVAVSSETPISAKLSRHLAKDTSKEFTKVIIRQLSLILSIEHSDNLLLSELAIKLSQREKSIRHDFFKNLLDEVTKLRTTDYFVNYQLHKIIKEQSYQDRLSMVKYLLDNKRGRISSKLIFLILREVDQVSELKSMLTDLENDGYKLKKTKELQNLKALAYIQPAVTKIKLPQSLNKYCANKTAIRTRIVELKDSLIKLKNILNDNRELYSTSIYKKYHMIYKQNKSLVSNLENAPKRQKSVELREAYNTLKIKLSTELKFSIQILFDEQHDFLNESKQLAKKYQEICNLLKIIKPIDIYRDTNLNKILLRYGKDRSDCDVDGSLANYHHDTISLFPAAFNESIWTKSYRNRTSLAHNLMHEIGHAFQYSITETLVKKDTNEIVFGSSVRFDMDEFLAIAGWKAKRSGYRVIDDDHVRIDGKDYPLDTAVNFKGTTVTLRLADYDKEKLLYICKAEGDPEFGKGYNSRYSPSEHWANAIMMYYFSPTIMSQTMPKTYRYLQDNFSIYYPDPLPKISPQSKIYKDLKIVKDSFIKLSRIEQSFILQTLIKDTDISATGNSFHAVSELSALSDDQRLERFVLILSKYPDLIDDKLTRILNQLVEIGTHRNNEITSLDTNFLA